METVIRRDCSREALDQLTTPLIILSMPAICFSSSAQFDVELFYCYDLHSSAFSHNCTERVFVSGVCFVPYPTYQETFHRLNPAVQEDDNFSNLSLPDFFHVQRHVVMYLAFFALLFYHSFTSFLQAHVHSNTRQAKDKDNSSIDDTRNAVLLLQTDYKANCRYSRPSPRHHPGPRSKPLLRQVHNPLPPSTTRRTDGPDDHLQTSPSPRSTVARRQRLPCLWVGDLEPERQHGEDR